MAKNPEALPAYLEEPLTNMASTIVEHEVLVGDAISAVRLEPGGSNSPQYCVQPGDTLRGIALKYGVDVCPFHEPSTFSIAVIYVLTGTKGLPAQFSSD